MTIRTILVDDESLAIQGLALRLQAHEDVEIVETCTNGREAIRAILKFKFKPKVVNGQGVEQVATQTIEFDLPDD